MIQREFYRQRADGVRLIRTYSDEGYLIRQRETGELYMEAIDIEDAQYTYEETTLTEESSTEDSDILLE